MSEPLRIVCPCGYENWIPEEKRGQTVPCFICGEDLVVDDAPADASPSENPAAAAKSIPTARPRSPFEDDTLDTAVRPKFQHAPPTPTAAPPSAPRARNPFEADGPPEDAAFRRDEQSLVADPFSRELVPAPKAGPSVSDEMEKHRPTERRSKNVFIDTISPHDAPTGEKCMQCGRPIRGSWDRVETHLGVFCYVCSNQATHDVPERVKAGSGRRTELHEHELLVDPRQIRNAAPIESPYGVTQTSGFKKIILWMAYGLLIVTFLIWLTGWGGSITPPDALGTATTPDAGARPVPDLFRYIMWTVRLIGALLGAVIAIYLTLDRKSGLPHERFFLNFMNIGALVVLVGLAQLGVFFVNYFFIDDPLMSALFNVVVGMALFAWMVYLLIAWFDFEIGDFLWLIFLYLPMIEIVIGGIGYFLQWGFYEWIL